MKRLIILLAILLPLSSIAQTPTFESLFKEYSLKEGCTTINISNTMLKSMNINIYAEYMQVISVGDKELTSTFSKQAKGITKDYEVIMSVNTGGNTVDIYQQKNDKDEVSDIYLLACSADECVFMHIKGHDLELSNIGSIMNHF